MLDKTTILCGRCITPPDVEHRPATRGEVRCAKCGQTDTVSRALSEARKYATHEAARSQDQKFAARGDAVRSFTPTRAPYKALRWITGVLGKPSEDVGADASRSDNSVTQNR